MGVDRGHVGRGEEEFHGDAIVNDIWPLPAPVAFSLPVSQNSTSGFLGGVQAGYNWQSGWAVFGVQGDFAGLDVKGTAPCVVILSCTTESDWLATVSGRFGGVVADRALIYVKGGAAWMNSTHTVNLPNFAAIGPGIPIAGQALASTESTAFGWLIGLGGEYMITPNWTAFIEYNYIEFDRKRETNNLNLASLGPAGAVLPAISCERGFQEQALDCQGRRELQVRLGCQQVLSPFRGELKYYGSRAMRPGFF